MAGQGLILAGSLASTEANFSLKQYATLYGNSTGAPRCVMALESMTFNVRYLQPSLAHPCLWPKRSFGGLTPSLEGRWAIFVTFLLAVIHHCYVVARSRTHTDTLELGSRVRHAATHSVVCVCVWLTL